jgi:hypothetical protein
MTYVIRKTDDKTHWFKTSRGMSVFLSHATKYCNLIAAKAALYWMTNKAGWEIVYFYHAEEDYKKYESNQLAIIHEVKLQLAGNQLCTS